MPIEAFAVAVVSHGLGPRFSSSLISDSGRVVGFDMYVPNVAKIKFSY